MAFENVREQLREQWADLSSKIQENPTFNGLREKFESQTPTAQKTIIAVACVVAVLFVLSFPYSYISSSNTYMSEFEENRSLIQGLLRASRTAKEPSPLPPPMPPDMLKGRVENMLRTTGLIPEQIGAIDALAGRPAENLAPPVVQQSGMVVQLKKLNLHQIITLAHGLQELGPGMKLMGLDVSQSAKQTHYYDMTARIVYFSLPTANDDMPEDAPVKGGKPRFKATPKEDEESE